MSVFEKPDYYSAEHAAAFQFPAVAASYWTRPPYPPQTFDELQRLIVDQPRTVLDVGCGIGNFARELAPRVERVDAVDISVPMLDEARRQPGGDASNIRWLLVSAETADLHPPYALIVAGASLHWMDWNIVLPRFARILTPNGVLVIVEEVTAPPPWQGELMPIILKYTTNRTLDLSFDWIRHLHDNGLLELRREIRTDSVPFAQPVERYVESFHARESLTRERLGPARAAAFDAELGALLARHTSADVSLNVSAQIWIAKPKP